MRGWLPSMQATLPPIKGNLKTVDIKAQDVPKGSFQPGNVSKDLGLLAFPVE